MQHKATVAYMHYALKHVLLTTDSGEGVHTTVQPSLLPFLFFAELLQSTSEQTSAHVDGTLWNGNVPGSSGRALQIPLPSSPNACRSSAVLRATRGQCSMLLWSCCLKGAIYLHVCRQAYILHKIYSQV